MDEQLARPTPAASLATGEGGSEPRRGGRSGRHLFLANGYVGTSVGAIARDAGVALQTVYNSVGSTADILSAVLDAHAQGLNAPRSVPEFMAERTTSARNGLEMVEMLSDWFVEVHQRTAVVFGIIRQAAAVDAAAAALERQRADRRRTNYLGAAAALRELGAIPPGREDEDIAAAIFTLGHPDIYRALVLDGGWTIAHYRAWLRDCLSPDPRVNWVAECVVTRECPSDKGELGLLRHSSTPQKGHSLDASLSRLPGPVRDLR